jgi:hypothetical protein
MITRIARIMSEVVRSKANAPYFLNYLRGDNITLQSFTYFSEYKVNIGKSTL